MKKIACSLVALSALIGTAAHAAEPGVYFGVSGGSAYYDATDKGFTYTSVNKNDKTNSGVKVFGGYSFGQWGLEVGQYDFGKFGISGISGGQAAEDEYGLKAFAISANAFLPVNRDMDFTMKFGFASATSTYHCLNNCAGLPNTSTDSTVPIVGLGLRWKVARNLGLRVDWEGIGGVSTRFGNNEEKTSGGLFSAGIEARF
jgi:hypothetical protein